MSENKIYNESQKERFLDFISDNEDTKTTIRRIFHKSWIYEDIRQKDLCNFNLEEIGRVIEGSNPFNLNVARSTTRFLSSYLSWSITHGLRDNNINPLDGVSVEWIRGFVDETKKIHYSYSEFLQLLEKIPSNQDRVLLFLAFEGIIGEKFSELQTLKYSDIDTKNNKVFVKDRDQWIDVSPACIDYLIKANEETTYEQYNSKNNTFTTKQLLSSEFLFKNVCSPRSNENNPVGMSVLYNRLHNIRDYLHLEFLTPNALKQSGMIWMAYNIYKDEKILAYDQLAKIGEKYNFSTISNENNGKSYTYFNTYLMRDFMTPEVFEDLYNTQVEFAKK